MSAFPRRILQLDGMRGAAILLVLIWHFVVVPTAAGPQHSFFARVTVRLGLLTWSGVDLFFVLSGFLIGGILIDARGSSNYFRTFYIRRTFRILPIYLLLVVVYLFVWSLTPGQRSILRETLGSPMPWYLYFTFTQNFWLAHHEWNSVYLAATWSLAVEEQFYLVLPMIVWVLPRRLLLPVAVLITLGAAVYRSLLYLHYGPFWGTAAYTLILSRADALMLGVICAVLLRDPPLKEFLGRYRWLAAILCTLFGFGVGIFICRGWGMGSMPMCTLGFTCLALFYASLLMLVVLTPNGFLSRGFRTRWLRWLGTISYGLYLFHTITLGIAAPLRHRPATAGWLGAVAAVFALIAAVGLAHLSWNHFESKPVQLGHQFIYRSGTQNPSVTPLSLASE